MVKPKAPQMPSRPENPTPSSTTLERSRRQTSDFGLRCCALLTAGRFRARIDEGPIQRGGVAPDGYGLVPRGDADERTHPHAARLSAPR